MERSESNRYSAHWFDFFHVSIPEARTENEVGFIVKAAPLPSYRRVADVCCGMGRHARALCERGYSVIGIERDASVVAEARKLAGGPEYVEMDVRQYSPEPSSFDAAIIMSQSFGLFDPVTNRDLLVRIRLGLRENGRIILDNWNPDFFAPRAGENQFDLAKGRVKESRQVVDGRLYVRLDYPDGSHDAFDWQMFNSEEMAALAQSAGLALEVSCANYNLGVKPSPAQPKIQFLLKRS